MLNQLYGSNGQATVDLTQGLVAHYLLNNNGDDSHGTYDGGIYGAIDVEGDSVNIPYSDLDVGIKVDLTSLGVVGDFSISTWTLTDSLPTNTEIMYGCDMGADGTNRFISHFPYTDGNCYFDFNNSTSGRVVFPFEAGWYGKMVNVVHTISSTSISIYVNGVLKGSIAHSGLTFDLAQNFFGLGAHMESIDRLRSSKNCNMSNVRVYNEAKDQTFIDVLYEEGYYPKPLPLPTTDGLIAHYPLTGTAEDTTGNYDSTEVSATYKDDSEFGSVYDGGGSITINTTATGLATWCCYWVDTGAGWVFTKTTTIPSTLTTNDYRNLRLYSLTPSIALQDEIEEYEKNFRPIDIDDGLVAYYPLANNSLDNYKNQYDGTDTAITYDGQTASYDGSTSNSALGSLSPNTLDAFCISLWGRADDAVAGGGTFFGADRYDGGNGDELWVGYGNGGYFGFTMYNRVLGAYVFGDVYTEITADHLQVLADGNLHHVFAEFDGAVAYLYVDNKLTVVYTQGVAKHGVAKIHYLGWNSATSRLDGNQCKVRVYNKRLTQEQKTIIYNKEKGELGL